MDAANSQMLSIANSLADSRTRLELKAACTAAVAARHVSLLPQAVVDAALEILNAHR